MKYDDIEKFSIHYFAHVVNNLPILCDFLRKKGVEIEDKKDIVSLIVKVGNIYEAMHR